MDDVVEGATANDVAAYSNSSLKYSNCSHLLHNSSHVNSASYYIFISIAVSFKKTLQMFTFKESEFSVFDTVLKNSINSGSSDQQRIEGFCSSYSDCCCLYLKVIHLFPSVFCQLLLQIKYYLLRKKRIKGSNCIIYILINFIHPIWIYKNKGIIW